MREVRSAGCQSSRHAILFSGSTVEAMSSGGAVLLWLACPLLHDGGAVAGKDSHVRIDVVRRVIDGGRRRR